MVINNLIRYTFKCALNENNFITHYIAKNSISRHLGGTSNLIIFNVDLSLKLYNFNASRTEISTIYFSVVKM